MTDLTPHARPSDYKALFGTSIARDEKFCRWASQQGSIKEQSRQIAYIGRLRRRGDRLEASSKWLQSRAHCVRNKGHLKAEALAIKIL